ncbi:MAG: hypothetical protein HOO96_13870 [Polyangiaceae bacterium]|nr:hypothetical protein [Polyangiaceae bacterium]
MLPRPKLLWITSLLLAGLAATAAAEGMATFAVYAGLMALAPLRARKAHVAWGSALGFGAFGWYALGVAPAISGLSLGGPFGGAPVVFAVAAVITVLRLVALRHAATRAWVAAGLARDVEAMTQRL